MFLLVEQTQRMLEEKAQLDLLSTKVDWLASHHWTLTDGATLDVCVDAELNIHGVCYPVRLVYPQLFPDTPAFVIPRGAKERWSGHQYGQTGALCLEYGPDNWHPTLTGVDVLESCAKLLLSETKPGKQETVSSRHLLTLGQEVRGTYRRFVKTKCFSELINSLGNGSVSRIAVAINMLNLVSVAACTASGVGKLVEHGELPRALSDPDCLGSWVCPGFLVVDEHVQLPNSITFKELEPVLIERSLWPIKGTPAPYTFIAILGANRKLRILNIYQSSKAEPTVNEYEVIDGSNNDDIRLPAAYSELSEKTVAIVGLGSVGSKIAVSLARSGLQKFVLVDDDVMLPGNLVRNQLDWMMVGFSKVNAVAEEITRVAPGAAVEKRAHRLGGQENSQVMSTTLNKIRTADLIIDATANPDVFILLAALCNRAKKPLIWGELFAGGIGALMSRSVPGVDASPLSVRDGVNRHLETLPKAPYMQANRYDTDEGDAPLIATDAAVTQLAASMSAYALDALTRKIDPEYVCSAYLMGYTRDWIFSGPFDTRPIYIPDVDLPPDEPKLTEGQMSALDTLFSEILVNAKLAPPNGNNSTS